MIMLIEKMILAILIHTNYNVCLAHNPFKKIKIKSASSYIIRWIKRISDIEPDLI